MLCLGGPNSKHYGGVSGMLNVLLSHGTSGAEKRRILWDDYHIQMAQSVESEVSVICN